jgi:hypothetical protein
VATSATTRPMPHAGARASRRTARSSPMSSIALTTSAAPVVVLRFRERLPLRGQERGALRGVRHRSRGQKHPTLPRARRSSGARPAFRQPRGCAVPLARWRRLVRAAPSLTTACASLSPTTGARGAMAPRRRHSVFLGGLLFGGLRSPNQVSEIRLKTIRFIFGESRRVWGL